MKTNYKSLVRHMKGSAIDQLQSANDLYDVIRKLVAFSEQFEDEPEKHDVLMKELDRLFDLANCLSLEAKKMGDAVKSASGKSV